MHGLVELLDCLDNQYHFLLSCVCALWTWGFFNVFCALFRLPNVGQGYNDITLSLIGILCAPNLPSDPMPLWGGPMWSFPLYQIMPGKLQDVLWLDSGG